MGTGPLSGHTYYYRAQAIVCDGAAEAAWWLLMQKSKSGSVVAGAGGRCSAMWSRSCSPQLLSTKSMSGHGGTRPGMVGMVAHGRAGWAWWREAGLVDDLRALGRGAVAVAELAGLESGAAVRGDGAHANRRALARHGPAGVAVLGLCPCYGAKLRQNLCSVVCTPYISRAVFYLKHHPRAGRSERSWNAFRAPPFGTFPLPGKLSCGLSLPER